MIFFFFLTLLPTSANAGTLCDYYRSNQPEMYKLLCGSEGGATTKPAGANSTFSSAFNLNSASLPTEPSSYGLETLLHFLRGQSASPSPTFSIVKGFRKFGTGVSTGGNNTFYGDDIARRLAGPPELQNFDPPEPELGSFTNLNIGTSISLFEFKSGPTIRLGLSARYNKISDTWGGGPALLLNWTYFSLGAGYTREQVSNFLPRLRFTSVQASARFWLFEVQFDQLGNDAHSGLEPIQIFTGTITIGRLILTGARRKLNYAPAGEVIQHHYAIQYLFSSSLSAGFLVNYLPGTSSIGVQYFL